MIVTAELLAFARGYSEGIAGTDTLPYHQIDEPYLVKMYYLGRAHGAFDGKGEPLPKDINNDDMDIEAPIKEPAIPIRAKTAG